MIIEIFISQIDTIEPLPKQAQIIMVTLLCLCNIQVVSDEGQIEMDTLLTFAGFHVPYSKGLVDQEDQPVPILLLNVRSFEHVFLFDTPTVQVTGVFRLCGSSE